MLNAHVERFAVAQLQRTRIHTHRERLHGRRIGVDRCFGEDTGVLPAPPGASQLKLLAALEPSCGANRPARRRRSYADGVVDQTKGGVDDRLWLELIGQAKTGSEVEVVFVLLEAVAGIFGKDERSGNSIGGADRRGIEVCPVSVLLVEGGIVIPAEPRFAVSLLVTL